MNLHDYFEDIFVGDFESVTRLIERSDLEKFADAIDSHHPLHMNEDWTAANSQYKKPIIHGVMTAALISRPTVNFLKKRNIDSITIYVASKFVAPVRVGDEITFKLTVSRVDKEKRRIIFATEATNQNNIVVLVGEAHEKIV